MNKLFLIGLVMSSVSFGESRVIEVNRDYPNVPGANEATGSREVVRIANGNRDIIGAVAGNIIGRGGWASGVGAVAGAIISRDPNKK
jgi:uncharacterized membrane protein